MKNIDSSDTRVTAGSAQSIEASPAREDVSTSLWRSLRYLGIYRVVVAMVFLVIFLMTGSTTSIASQDPSLFLWADCLYLLTATVFLLAMGRVERGFDFQLSIQVASDIVFLTLLMYASGGARSGIAFMLVVVVAGAGLVGQGRMTLFYAALATLAVLLEHSVRMFRFNADIEDFMRVGLTSIGFFATALIAQLLARRVIANERLAQQRGAELADQVRINRQVIRDMEDGVLVVESGGRVRLHNPRAEQLLGQQQLADSRLAALWPHLASQIANRRHDPDATSIMRLPVKGRMLQVRLLSPDQAGNTLIYLQDIDRLQYEARQSRLAALGRLTANIAHEIRNPLAAVSHAAELLADEQRADSRVRLVRIIVDNVGRLNRLVGEVLELGRRDRAQPETINLTDFLQCFLDEYAVRASDTGHRLSVVVGPEASMCFDRSHLHRVIDNLVTNALRYASSRQGAVGIKVDSPAPGRVELHIIDDGPGIPEVERGKVFEPFFTTHGSGTGLGLYIARELCEANDAALDLVDDTGGAHFRISARGGPCLSGSSAATAVN